MLKRILRKLNELSWRGHCREHLHPEVTYSPALWHEPIKLYQQQQNTTPPLDFSRSDLLEVPEPHLRSIDFGKVKGAIACANDAPHAPMLVLVDHGKKGIMARHGIYRWAPVEHLAQSWLEDPNGSQMLGAAVRLLAQAAAVNRGRSAEWQQAAQTLTAVRALMESGACGNDNSAAPPAARLGIRPGSGAKSGAAELSLGGV